MLPGKLESFSRKHPELRPFIQQLAGYVRQQRNRGVRELIPRVAAVALGITEADLLGLLTLFEDAELIKHQYDLVCVPSGAVIASFPSLDKIPSDIECQHCGVEHNGETLRIDLVFNILREQSADAAA
jgi:hypothetical protein